MSPTQPPRRAARAWITYAAVATAAGAFLGAVGPYGSYLNGPAHVRIGYWVATCWLGLLALVPAARAAAGLARRWDAPAWLGLAAAMLVACAPLAWLYSIMARAIWPRLPAMSWFDWYAQVLAIAAFQFALYGLANAALRGPTPPPSASGPTGFTPDAGETLCLQMEDHYVRVHAMAGSRLVHGTMRDAIAAQAGRDGLRVHRSWWVARSAVRACVWEGRRLRLELSNGISAPVARSAVARLRAAGWLDPARSTAAAMEPA